MMLRDLLRTQSQEVCIARREALVLRLHFTDRMQSAALERVTQGLDSWQRLTTEVYAGTAEIR